jgi:tetratricopeptide (TPR) repeat protein
MIRFVGRERERAALVAGWTRACAGGAHHVLMAGEAGVGKTRLVDELITHVRKHPGGARVLRGRCWDVGGAPAYWPWIQAFGFLIDELGADAVTPHLFDLDPALARLLPRLRGALGSPADHDEGGSEAAQLRLFDAVVLLLRRLGADRPVLLVLDDLESADAMSLQLLRFLVRARTGGPLMVVAIYRTPVPPDAPAATPLWSIGREPGVDLLTIAGLPPEELVALMTAMDAPGDAALARALHARTQGNPLFASEFIRLLGGLHGGNDAEALVRGAPLPASVRGVIQQRLLALPARCRELLSLGAVLGREIDLGTLARMTGSDLGELLEALSPALGSGVLEEVPARPMHRAFAHPLLRQSLYEELPVATRGRLHQQVADTLRERHADALDEHLDAIASHYVAALAIGSAPLALEFCRRAAARAASLGARDEAVRMLQLALEAVLAMDDPRLACEILLELGDAQARAGRADEAQAALLQVAERAERLGLPTYLARAAFGFGGRFLWARVTRESPELSLIERALGALPPEEISLRARLLARLSGLQRDRRRAQENAERCRQAVGLARRSGDGEALSQVLTALALHELATGTTEQFVAAAEDLGAAARAAGNVERELAAQEFQAIARLESGDTSGAEDAWAVCTRMAERLGQLPQRWFVAVIHAAHVLVRGELGRAEELAWGARRMQSRGATAEMRFLHFIQAHLILREQDRLAELLELADESVAHLPTYALVRCLRTQLWGLLGRSEEARGYLDRQVTGDFADIQDTFHYRFMLGICTEMADQLGHTAAARSLEPRLGEVTQRHLHSPPAASAGSVLRYRGLCAGLLGRGDEAARLLAAAATENRTAGAVIWALRSELDRARYLPAAEARPAVQAVLEEARARRLPALIRESSARLAEEQPRSPVPTVVAGALTGPLPLYRREGEFWTIGWSGESLRLRDSKGLRYLGQLLARAGDELAALELAATDGGTDPDSDEGAVQNLGGDLGPVLDATARAAFQQRLAALDASLLEAENWNDRARAGRLREERDALAQELAAAVGLGGRDRRMGDIAERARQSVTKAIKGAIRRIGQQHGELGRHLDSTVHTGLFCRYEPDPVRPPPWQVEL